MGFSQMQRILSTVFLLISLSSTAFAQLSSNDSPSRVLQNLPKFSTFNRLLTETGVLREVEQRSSLTLLVPENSVLDAVVNRSSNNLPLPLLADVLRYHCLLQYLDMPEIRSMANVSGMLVTSLYQTTGRAAGQSGFVNISVANGGAIHAGVPFAENFNATVETNITQFPYNISYLKIDQVLIPTDIGRPQAAAASILNLTMALQRAGRFNSFLSLMQTTGLTAVLASLPSFTVFAPTDDAFRALPKQVLDTLSPSQATSLLEYHTLPSYVSFGSLQGQGSFVQTVASGGNNQRFLVQVANGGNGVVSLSTGLNTAQIVSSIMDQPPVAAYSINRVLLPSEIFRTAASANDTLAPAAAPSNVVGAPAFAPVAVPVPNTAAPVLVPAAAAPIASVPPPSPVGAGSATPGASPVVGNLPPAAGPAASVDSNASSPTSAAGPSEFLRAASFTSLCSRGILVLVSFALGSLLVS